jgi:outer membrane protein, heavy metal efflux system
MQADAQGVLTEDDIVIAVTSSDHVVRAARLSAEAGARRPEQITWPFPMVDIGLMPSMIADGETGAVIMARQKVPWPGLLAERRQERRHEAAAAVANADAIERERILEARLAYADLWGAQREIAIMDSFIQRIGIFEEGALAAYSSGRAPQQGVIQVQVERERLLQRRDRVEDDAIERREQLRRLTGGRVVVTPTTILAPPPQPDPPAMLSSRLPDVVSAHPSVREGLAMQAAESASIEIARLEGRPEITLGADVNLSPMARDRMFGLEPVMPVVGLSLPLWRSGIRAEIEEATVRREQRREETEAARLELETDAQAIVDQIGRTDARIERLETRLRPRVELAVESMLGAMRTGTAGTIDLLDLERSAIEIDTDLLTERTRRARLYARLKAITGE